MNDSKPLVFLACIDALDQSRFKEFDIMGGLGCVELTDQLFPLLQPKPKATEVMYLTNDVYDRMRKILPSKPAKTGIDCEIIILGDIIIANTIPSPDIEFIIEPDKSTKIVGRVIPFPRDTIIELMKTSRRYRKKEDDTGVLAIYQIGVIEIRMFNTVTGAEAVDHRLRVSLQMTSDLELMFSPMYISSSNAFYEYIEQLDPEELFDDIYGIVIKVFVSWYATQTALLNPVIAERFHRETVPYDIGKKTIKKGKKAPKRYVKQITIDDLSDLEFGREKRPHQIKEPLWWVSGHWRNQATKDGHKRIFIQGYWKGILRNESDSINVEPRERETVFEENDGKPYFIE